MRNLTKTLAMVSLLVPASAFPLGIGEIKLHSALNQKLDADIALVLAPGEKADDIKVSLAPPEKFDESGVPWTYFLSKLNFRTTASNGNVVVKVTSKEALKEPFLDFLLEVSWPKGNLYREFTVLVDPPTEFDQSAAPVSVQASGYSDQQGAAFAPPQPRPRRQGGLTRPVAVDLSSGAYGPTVKNDTLWKVAERISRQTGVSIEQTMIGLYEANPDAFYKPNVNALLAGKKLKIPEREVFLKFSRQQAIAQFNQQNAEWRNPSTEAAMPTIAEKTESQLTLAAPKQETSPETGAVSAGAQPSTEAGTKAPEAGTPEQPTQEVKEATGAPASNQVIEEKIAALEQQLAAMQKLMALKDEQLAALQQQGQAKSAPPQQQVPQGGVQKPAGTEQQIKPVPTKPITPQPAKITQPPPEATTAAWSYVAGGVGAGLLVYVGWLVWRRRSQTAPEIFGEQTITSAFQAASKAGDVFQGSAPEGRSDYASGLEGENLFGGDLTVGEFDMFDLDQSEIDPVSEADVYMAYGRYQQAEELIRLAIKDQPLREDYKLKLLEIFFATENRQAFENYANELFNAGDSNNSIFWEKVVEMGGELCPESVLFTAASQKSEPSSPSFAEPSFSETADADKLLDGTDFDLASFEELFGIGTSKEEVLDELDQTTASPEKNIPAEHDKPFISSEEPPANNQPIDFDLTGLTTSKEEAAEKVSSITAPKFDIESEPDYFQTPRPKPAEHDKLNFSFEKPISFKDSIADTAFDDDFDFSTAIGSVGQLDEESRFGATDITEMDEMELQLDLAIAYIDMGDKDAAKEIATQIYEKGTAEQKTIAKSLLDNL